MDNLQTLTSKVNDKIKDSPIFFVTNDPERALGLEKILENYHIICIDDNDIIDYMQSSKVKVFSLEKEIEKLNAIFRNSNRLLNQELTKKYIENNTTNGNASLMFFKIAPNLERTTQNLGFNLINTSSKLNRAFELKIPQYKFLKDIPVFIPKTIVMKFKDVEYEELSNKLGKDMIVQFNRGHTGGGTIEVQDEGILLELQKIFSDREVKFSEKIVGPAYTLNACITKHGICWGALSYQITGVEECTANQLATVGNDWYEPKKLDKNVRKKISNFVQLIGKAMQKDGFLGMFGLDIVVEKNTNKPNIIEINARQPASIPMFTKMQLDDNQIPLSLLAICEFLNIDYNININDYNENASKPFEASQIFIRNKFNSQAKLIGSIKVGTYRLVGRNIAYDWSQGSPRYKSNIIDLDEEDHQKLIFDKELYSIRGIKRSGMLILAMKEGKMISRNAEVGRIQALCSLIDDNGDLKSWTSTVIKGLNKYLVLRESRYERETT